MYINIVLFLALVLLFLTIGIIYIIMYSTIKRPNSVAANGSLDASDQVVRKRTMNGGKS